MSKEQNDSGLRLRPTKSSSSISKSSTGNGNDARANKANCSNTPSRTAPSRTANKSTVGRGPPPYCPSGKIAFFLFVIVRLSAAFYSNIADCDEYSPKYAIRSWAYIKLHAIVGGIFNIIFGHDKIKVFYTIRVVFAILCALSESMFYVSTVSNLGPRVGRYLIISMLFSAGIWNASTAFLPSTFAMYTTMVAFFYALRAVSQSSGRRIYKTIFWVGLGSLLAWPFGAAIGIPAAFEELTLRTSVVRKKFERVQRLIFGLMISMCLILVPLVLADSYYYKQFNIVPLNIIMYNVFGGKDRGPELYGTEPWHFYIKNGLLNFNFLFILALISLPGLSTRRHYIKMFTTSILLISGLISLSRISALYINYNAPIKIYKYFYYVEIPQQIESRNIQLDLANPINLCVGKEWYRFPSHYFLPNGVRLRFLKSNFNGQLPKYFPENHHIDPDGRIKMSNVREGTWKIPEGFNDINQEEMDRYVNIEQCEYIIDLEMNYTRKATDNEPRYAAQTDKWSEVICERFLDNENSDRISRAFYLPPEIWKRIKRIIKYLPVRTFNSNAVNRLGELRWGSYCLLRKKA
ncbi:4173_t:CDS:2 [Diversispora eburnea]|uniref:Mannosyltransferase n=1 Tax=Diversispora eburnea TaxID=1213867 RepID=A0A9N9CP20_9GLOM|nr:4173_t:CDS:2 [Diversispora eburnea]